MQPSLTKPPMSGDETANPLPTTLPPLSPELPMRDQEPAPITETPPKTKAKGASILLPKALVDDLYHEARKNFALIPDMTFALTAGSRALRDMWEHKDGKFLRKERPYTNYVPPKDSEHGASLREAKAGPVGAESPVVAEARARWDEAKRQGDPDRMTRAANDLLRAVDTERLGAGDVGRQRSAEETLKSKSPEQSWFAQVDESRFTTIDIDDATHEAASRPAAVASADYSSAAANTEPAKWLTEREIERAVAVLATKPAELRSALIAEFGQHFGRSAGQRLSDALAVAVAPDGARAAALNSAPAATSQQSMLVAASAEENSEGKPWWETLQDWIFGESAPDDSPVDGGYVKPRYHPDDPQQGLERIRRAHRIARHGGRRPEPAGSRADWADPNVGWTTREQRAFLYEAAGREITPETLLMWSAFAYPSDFKQPNGEFVQPDQIKIGGWEVIGVMNDPGSGYYATAVRNLRTGDIVIANRGTEFDGRTDAEADIQVFKGQVPRQLELSREFLVQVWQKVSRGGVGPKIFVTGHSLGGAAAQFQMAASYADDRLTGMDISGVTFAAVGARAAIESMTDEGGEWRGKSIDIRRKASDRLINYLRIGDGMVRQRPGRLPRPERLGREVMLAGVMMDRIEEAERDRREIERDLGWLKWFVAPTAIGSLESMYFENHSLKSYYHPDFTRPVSQLTTRIWDRKR